MKTKIDVFDALKNIDLEKTNPVWIEDQCVYTDRENNHCLVGEIITYWGFELPDINEDENSSGIDHLYSMNFDDYQSKIDYEAIIHLSTLQIGADTGKKWKFIAEKYQEVYSELGKELDKYEDN